MRFFLCVLVLLPLTLALPGNDDEYHDILEPGQKDWRLAFRGTAHIKESVYNAYQDKYDTPVEEACKGVDFGAACNTHYRNDDALDNWWMVDEVLFGIVKDGALVKTLTFNGTDSTYMDWFSEDRYLDSCYKDLKSQPHNYFSINGQYSNRRRFFINRNYDRCQNNAGWFVALDGDESVSDCDWERNTGEYPRFLYSGGPTYSNWNDGGVNQADAIVIFVKYYPFGGESSEYFDVFDSGVREWRLAFRATSGVGAPVFEAYNNGAGIPSTIDDGCKTIDWTAECKSHYRNNDALNNYKWQDIDQVLFGIVADGAMVKTITFDALGTDKWSWFQQAKVVDSCWSDFKLGKNFFSIAGHRAPPGVQRTFFINNRYGGCPNDFGWVVAVDNAPSPPCPWEKSDHIPNLLFAAGPQMSNWNNRDNIHAADAFVVFIRYKIFE